MSTLYLDDEMMGYKDIFLQAIQDIEVLGYRFKPILLIHAYMGRSKKILGITYWYHDDTCLIEFSVNNHNVHVYDYGTHVIKDIQLSISTIYHELAHATVECHFKGHGKEFKTLRNKILETYRIDIGGAMSDYS
jgi:hypothetical protein